MFIDIILLIIAAYLAGGILFTFPFLLKGINLVDEGAHGSSLAFRIIIIPGIIVFWPCLLKKWITAKSKSHGETT